MTDVPTKEAEVRPVVTLRQAVAFYDALPEKTRKQFCELTSPTFSSAITASA